MSSDSTEFDSIRSDIKETEDRIYKAISSLFDALTYIFVWPIFLSLAVYPCYHLAIFHPDFDYVDSPQSQPSHFSSNFEITVLIVCTLFFILFYLCAVATITYSVVQVYHDRSVNFVSSIKSIRNSFFPLLSTFIISHTIYISITLVVALILLLLSQILQSIGLIQLKFDLNHLIILVIFTLIVLVPILVWLQVNWSLAYVIAVVESKWGFETLKRSSAYLVEGKRRVAFWIYLYMWLTIGGAAIGTNVYLLFLRLPKYGWVGVPVTMTIMVSWMVGSFGMSYFLRMKVLLYLYCKDFNGQKLTSEIGDKFVSQPLDDEKNHEIV